MSDEVADQAMALLEEQEVLAGEVSSWPKLGDAAFYGVLGDIVRTLEPHTEADPAALLLTLQSATGVVIGSKPHAVAEASQHPARFYVLVIGRTAHGRKGASFSQVRRVLEVAVPDFVKSNIVSGLSSGEGLISAVRDGKDDEDPGVLDKRLWVVEEEFARVLKQVQRDGNILSPVIRSAWDRADIRTLTRHDPLKATGTHIGIVGHTTLTELRKTLLEVEVVNGFANRFLPCLANRSKKLAHGGSLSGAELERLGIRLRGAIEMASRFEVVRRSDAANERWAQIYEDIDDGRDGLVGASTARAEAQMLRLSVLYAILDGSDVIEVPHLEAAKAVWDYCDASVRYIWDNTSLGDDIADRLLTALKDAGPTGLDYSAQSALFSRHVKAPRLKAAREVLRERGLIVEESIETAGKSRTVTRYVGAKEANKAKQETDPLPSSPISLTSPSLGDWTDFPEGGPCVECGERAIRRDPHGRVAHVACARRSAGELVAS